MISKIIEATEARGLNLGKFLVQRFSVEEWNHRSQVDSDRRLLSAICGWTPEHVMVTDLATGEGALFRIGGLARADLNKHRIWVCPLFEPFLEWLYRQDCAHLDRLPAVVDLGDVGIVGTQGYRRPGK